MAPNPNLVLHFGTPGQAGYDSSHLEGSIRLLYTSPSDSTYVLESGLGPTGVAYADRIRRISAGGSEFTHYNPTIVTLGNNPGISIPSAGLAIGGADGSITDMRITSSGWFDYQRWSVYRRTGQSTATNQGVLWTSLPAQVPVVGEYTLKPPEGSTNTVIRGFGGYLYFVRAAESPAVGKVMYRFNEGDVTPPSELFANLGLSALMFGFSGDYIYYYANESDPAYPNGNYTVYAVDSSGFPNFVGKINYDKVRSTSSSYKRCSLRCITLAPDGNIYFVVQTALNGSGAQSLWHICKMTPGGTVTTLYDSRSDDSIPTTAYNNPPAYIVGDANGHLYFTYTSSLATSLAIYKLAGVYPPVPISPPDEEGSEGAPDTGQPKLSTLTDNFNSSTVNSSKWTTLGPVSIVGQALQLGDSTLSGYLRSFKTNYQFDSAQVLVKAAGRGSTPIRIEDTNGDWMEIIIDSSNWTIRARWYVGGVSGNGDASYPIEYDFTQHKYFRIKRGSSATIFDVSQDGLEWTRVATHGFGYGKFTSVKAVLIGNLMTSLDNFNILVPIPPEPEEPSFPDVPIPDPSDPDAPAPPSGNPSATQPTCKSVLDWVREFSSGVKQPIRITGPSTIEMVNVSAPLPTGWTNTESPSLYTSSNQALTAGEKTLALGSGKLVLTANGKFATNDIRLITSNWVIPHQLPVYAHHNALVKQVRYSFTPEKFSATVDFHYNPVTPSPGRIS
jgi:hypothetical protein